MKIAYDKKMMECYADNVPITVRYPEHDISRKFFDLAEKVSKKSGG